MKIKFSNVVKMFLAGALFAAVGCTDYGQDIENLNNRIDALEADTIDPLKADLKQAQESLAAAQKAIEDYAAQHAADVAALQAADAALDQAVKAAADKAAEDLAALANELRSADAQLATQLSTLSSDLAKTNEIVASNAAAITALQTALNAAVDSLEKAIAAGDAALAEQLNQTKTALTALIEGYVADLQSQINTINTEITGLKGVDASLQSQINDLVAALATLSAQVTTNKENIEALNAALDSHIAAFEAYKAEVAGLFAVVNAQLEELKKKDEELAGLIAALDTRLAANEALAAQNAADIKANKALFDEFVAATNATLQLLIEADKALNTRIDELNAALETYKASIRKELDEHYQAFADYQKTVADNFAAVDAELANQLTMITANIAAIEANKSAIAANAAAIAALDTRLAALESAHSALEAKHNALQASYDAFVAATNKAISDIQAEQLQQNGTLTLHTEQIATINSNIKTLDQKVDTIYAELKQAISVLDKKLQDQIDVLKGDVSALKERIQSIVYVPEYVDGMATIEYALFGNKIIECNSVLTYQVHPANCAGAVKKEDLSFLFQGLKASRAATGDAAFEVVGVSVADAAKGYINVTVQAHNLGNNFYNGQAVSAETAMYAVSLVYNHKSQSGVENNIASCYTTLIAEPVEDASVISMGILNNKNKEIHSEKDQPVESHEIIYSNLEAKREFMPGNYPVFKLGNGKWFTYEQIVSAGYQISTPKQTITYAYFDKENKATNAFKSVFNNVEAGEGYKYVTTNLAKVEKLAVKSYETVTYKYATDGISVSTTGKLTITKDKGTFNLGEVQVDWARNLDNKKTNYVRDNIKYVLAEKVLPGKNTYYSEAVAGTLTSLTVNGTSILANAWNLEDDAISAELVKVGKDKEPVLKFEGFAWNQTYNFVAVYELDNIDVTINFAVKTVCPTFVINLGEMPITWNYAQDWKSEYGDGNEVTNRVLAVNVKETVETVEYTDGKDAPVYADVIKNGVQNELSPATPSYEFSAETIKCSSFKWNVKNNFTAEYALADALVTINGSINPVKNLKNIVVTLPESTQDIVPNLVIDETNNAINDVLAAAFTKQNVADLCLGTTTVEQYLTAIFNDATLPAATIVANKRTTDKLATVFANATTTTNLAVATNGQSVNTYFIYSDGYSPIPTAVVYNLTVKTWYDVEITFVKKVNFVLDTYNQYDYSSVDDFVYLIDGLYFSNAIPYYTYTPKNSALVNAVRMELNMNTAFNVVDKDNKLVTLDADGKNASLGLVSTFVLTDKHGVHGNGIKLENNLLTYHDRDAAVGVKAILTVVNSDGSLVATIPTQFDAENKKLEKGLYSDYEVKKYDPIQQSPIVTGVQFDVATDEAKTYVSYVMNGFQLKDKRGDNGFNLVEVGAEIPTDDLNNYDANFKAWYAPKWLVGNGVDNGYANGADVSDATNLYGLKFVYMDYDSAADRAKVENLVVAGALVVDDYATKGKITFKNGNQIQLTETVTFNIRVKVSYTWGERDFVVPVTLNRVPSTKN